MSLFPIWLIRSKVHPTKQRVHLLERPLLTQKLDECLNATLSVIHAPAGYGKSTLLADWRNKLILKDIAVCWLSVDKEDNELFQLLTYIAFSLSEGGVDFHTAGIQDSAFLKDLSPRSFLSTLYHVVEVQKKTTVLILDDFENLEKNTIDTIIKPLLEYAPDNFHVAIACRDDSQLTITSLEAQGLVTRIKAEDMRFTQEEIKTFFPNSLSKKTIQRLYQLTEGWPVTIQMFKNSTTTEQDIENLLTDAKASSNVITAYLSEQIFSNLDTELQEFLMDISLLDRVSYDFANYLRDREDSAVWFVATKPLNTLVLPVEQVGSTYRLHPIFREYLYERLVITNPSHANILHLRTADWFAEKGNFVKAAGHCLQANQPQRAVEIVEQAGGLIIWLREGLTRLRAVIKLFDKATINASPRITLIQCLLDIKDGKVYRARKTFDAVQQTFSEEKQLLKQADLEQIEHEMMLLESMLACYEGKMLSEQFCLQLNKKISRIDSTDHITLGHHFTLLCLAYVQRGMFQEARNYAEKAVDEFEYFHSIYGVVYINFHLGDIYFAEGKTKDAENYYQAGLNMVRQHFNDDEGMKLVAYVLIAELKYEINHLASLPMAFNTIPKQLEEREAWFDIYAAGYITASNVEFNKYGIDSAVSVLNAADAYAKTQKLERLKNLLTFQRIVLLLRVDKVTQARAALEGSGIELEAYKNPESSGIAWREYDAAIHAITLLLIKEKAFDTALTSLAYFSKHARTHGHIKSCIRHEILQSLAYQCKHQAAKSYQHLDKALTLSRNSGFIRAFIDEGPQLEINLQQFLNASPETTSSSENVEHANKLLSQFSSLNSQDDASDILSKREYDVLQQLTHGFSNKIIARNIAISENTVRFHLKNIFAKLHVDNRLQAVSVAQKRKII